MPTPIDKEEVQRLLREGAQLVEVLGARRYEEEHIPGAINIPLKKLNQQTADEFLERNRPVIVYCNDYE